ncbi:MAG: PEGA domain-containing protein [Gemmatimonadota bacterium]
MVFNALRALSAHPARAALLFLFGGLFAPIVLTACATIMQGTSQEIGISSQPTGARVTIDKLDSGTTPLVADLKRKNDHTIRIELDGYQPYELSITKHTSGWVWGNIVFGGLPGLAVDAITGGLYKLRPEQVEAELSRGDLGIHEGPDTIFIDVVLRPEPGWERVATLTPLEREGR